MDGVIFSVTLLGLARRYKKPRSRRNSLKLVKMMIMTLYLHVNVLLII